MLKQDLITTHFWRARLLLLAIVLVLAATLIAAFNLIKPLPEGLSYESDEPAVNLSDLNFLTDTTTVENGSSVSRQQIFDTAFKTVEQAKQYILVDMYLFNDDNGGDLGRRLKDALITNKRQNPNIKIDVLADPVNTLYGSNKHQYFEELKAAGINVTEVCLSPLRDSNPLYSGFWRMISWLPKGQFGSTAALNFKADHRKVILADSEGRLVAIIGSADARGSDQKNSNAAWLIKGGFGLSVYEAENAVAKMSGNSLSLLPENLKNDPALGENAFGRAKLLTEGRVQAEALKMINALASGDKLRLAMFYLADSDIARALIKAADRGAVITLILDPNKLNRQTACELYQGSGGRVKARWYRTTGEKFHTKLMIADYAKDNRLAVLTGSADFTRRSLDNFNLESAVRVSLKSDSELAGQIRQYFDNIHNNNDDQTHTVDYEEFADCRLLPRLFMRFQEWSGASSF